MQFTKKIGLILLAGILCRETKAVPDLPTDAAADTNSTLAALALKNETLFDLAADAPGRLSFTGSSSAELFTKEVEESFKGALEHDFVSKPDGKFPAGFINASPPGQPWYGTMWTRDGGTFMRELVYWGYYQHACQLAECMLDSIGTNSDGFYAYPRLIDPMAGRQRGSEMDGQTATIIGMVALWERLPDKDPFRARLYHYLHDPSSPVRGIDFFLKSNPLVPGSGEFGGGKGRTNYNVIQNNLSALALLAAAGMEDKSGDHATAKKWRKDAEIIFHNIPKYLVNQKGTWIWGIDIPTLKPNKSDEDSALNSGGGGLNGVPCMSADVLGFDPAKWPWDGAMINGKKTFEELYNFPQRKQQFDKYGFWQQMNYTHKGLLASPSYGQGYALQDMLLFDDLKMADRGLDFLAQATYHTSNMVWSLNEYHYDRGSPYWFFERMYSPEAVGKIVMSGGCGPLNLVNVAEPLKVARLIAGVDDTSSKEVLIIPRVPPSWSGYHMENWPIHTSRGLVRADISFEKTNGVANFTLEVKDGGKIPKLAVRLPEKGKTIWKRQSNVGSVKFTSDVP